MGTLNLYFYQSMKYSFVSGLTNAFLKEFHKIISAVKHVGKLFWTMEMYIIHKNFNLQQMFTTLNMHYIG